MSPEPLTPIDNNPPDETAIGHGGNPRHRQGTEGEPTHKHTKREHVRTQRATTPSTRPHPTSQKRTADLSKNSTRCLQTPPGITATCGQITRHKPPGSPRRCPASTSAVAPSRPEAHTWRSTLTRIKIYNRLHSQPRPHHRTVDVNVLGRCLLLLHVE